MNPTISSLKPKHRLGMQSACLAWTILALMGSFTLSIQAQTPQELMRNSKLWCSAPQLTSKGSIIPPLAESLENADDIRGE